MNKDLEKLDEQQAPEKNSDQAYVQVGSDGKPVLPKPKTTEQNQQSERPKEGTLADR